MENIMHITTKIQHFIGTEIIPLKLQEQYIVIGSTIATLMALKTCAEIQLNNQAFIDKTQEGFVIQGKEAYISLAKMLGINTEVNYGET